MAKGKQKFYSSISIRFDIGKNEFIERYLPTPSHVEPFLGVTNGLMDRGSQAHIVVGPYGSGKSLLGTVIAGIASKHVEESTFNRLVERFNQIHSETASIVKEVHQSNIKYIPILLEGNIANFRRSLITSIQKNLKKNNINILIPGVVTDILSKIESWRIDFPETFEKFQKLVMESWDWNLWRKSVERYDEKAIFWFVEVYPELTSGSQYQIVNFGDFLTQIEFVLGELHKLNSGLFIIHDEFGRFLQGLEQNQMHEAMQDLQEIAELANHSTHRNMSLLLITHRNMRHYASRYNDDLQKEFQRIEKRFITYYVESDQATFIRLSSYITSEYRKSWKGPEKEIVQGLTKFPLFSELTDYEVANLVVKGCFPMHPVSLFALPRLANIVAQNERTLFTLLESDEVGGLKRHFKLFPTWYTIDKLFDYFEINFETSEAESSVKTGYLLYKRILKRLSPTSSLLELQKIIKLLTIWNIANLQSKVLPTTEFIAFALNWSVIEAQLYLKELIQQKSIRYLNDEERWMLYEGSVVDVEKEIEERLYSFSLSTRKKMLLLEEFLPKKYYLSNEYNDKKSMTRFASVFMMHLDELKNSYTLFDDLLISRQSDMSIVFVIVEQQKSGDNRIEFLRSISYKNPSVIFVVPQFPFEELDLHLRRLETIRLLEQDKIFTDQDKFLTDELFYFRRELEHLLKERIKNYSTFNDKYVWHNQGKVISVQSERTLSKQMSELMNNVYPDTPVIKNEAFNRRSITKVQKNNAINLLNLVLASIHKGEQEFEVSGFGPDYLIYATVLKNNNIKLFRPEQITDASIIALRNKLLSYLLIGKGNVSDLASIFRESPFGIRFPVVPILFVTLLSKEWKYLMFYKNDNYVTSLDGHLIWNILNDSEDYYFTYQVPDERHLKLVQMIEDVYPDHVNPLDRVYQTPIYLSRILTGWFQSLTRFSRSTVQQSDESNTFREMVRLIELKPQDVFEELYHFTRNGTDRELILKIRQESEQFLDTHKIIVQKKINSLMEVSDFEQLKRWAKKQKAVLRKKSKLVSSILASDSNNWIDILSERLVGVSRDNWSDATDEVFVTELYNELSIIHAGALEEKYMEVSYGEGTIVIPKVELSKKSLIVYENIKRTLHFTGRTIPNEEMIVLLWNLLKDATTEKQSSINNREEEIQ